VFQNVNVPQSRPRKEWILTKETFDRFLAVLDNDRDKAGEKYEEIRLKLLKYFQWCGSSFPDIDADDAINRVMRRIDEGADVYNLKGYIYGVARLVHTESRRVRNRQQELDEASLFELSSLGIDAEVAQRQECLEHCLRTLSEEDRAVITEYYKHDKTDKITSRERLAARLGVSLNALRVKTHRQRLNLESCINKCLGRFE
jgi:DNA-directed RNA polymerase specialized sigma24 family protein